MIPARKSPDMLASWLTVALIAWAVASTARADAAQQAIAAGSAPDSNMARLASQAAAQELARKVANPLASLVSVPIQFNGDAGISPLDLGRTTVNLQPVVPIQLGPHAPVRLMSRTVVPFVFAEGGPVQGDVSGIGDVTQSLFVVNALPTRGGWTLGFGPVVQLPTGSDERLTNDTWSLGPTAIAVRQRGAWTYGALANHLWSVGADARHDDVSVTFVQPFLNYISRTHTTFALNTEANRDWNSDQWSVPVHVIVNQLLKVGPQPMSVFVGARYWAVSPEQGPEGFGWRCGTTLLFPTQRPPQSGGRR